jgi:ribosomal protein S18 acetylase RimI-like enzyme
MTAIVTPSAVPAAYAVQDRLDVTIALADSLEAQYPGGARWLERRLSDVEAGDAACHLIRRDGELAALAIETPKAPRRLKLSTFWVAPQHRRSGLGRLLARDCRDRWLVDDIEHVHVTASNEALAGVNAVLASIGFVFVCVEYARYGIARDETVLAWQRAQ